MREFEVNVINPFTIFGSAGVKQGGTASFELLYQGLAGVGQNENRKTKHLKNAVWKLDNVSLPVKAISTSTAVGTALCEFNYPNVDTVSHQIQIIVEDEYGHRLPSLVLNWQAGQSATSENPKIPVLTIVPRTSPIARNESVTLQVSCEACESTLWKSDKGINKKVEGNSLVHFFSTLGTDTLSVTGFNKIGQAGNTERFVVSVQDFTLSIRPLKFPETIQAKRLAEFEVTVTRDNLTETGALVTWSTNPAKVFESSKSEGLKFSGIISDSISDFTISAKAVSGKDISYDLVKTIRVLRYGPSVSLLSIPPKTLFVDDQLVVKFKAKDSNADGKIEGVYYLSSEANDTTKTAVYSKVPSLDSLILSFKKPGSGWIRLYSLDNDGFKSKIDTSIIMIVSANPIIDTISVSKTVLFKNGSIDVSVTAHDPFTNLQSIKIKLQGEQINDTITSIMVLDTIQSITKIIPISLSQIGAYQLSVTVTNTKGKTTEVKYKDAITVSDGKPVVQSIYHDIVWIRDTVSFKINAQDGNGTVKSYSSNVNSGSGIPSGLPNTFITRSESQFDWVFANAGEYTIKAFVSDNDNEISSTLEKKINVHLGKPSVTDTFPNLVYIKKEIKLPVAGTDSNGTIKSFHLSINSAPNISRQDGNFTHNFSSPGTFDLKVYVVDDDGISSDTLVKKIIVKEGRPEVTSIIAYSPKGTLFIGDSLILSVQGSDENGHIESILASWDGDPIFEAEEKALANQVNFKHVFLAKDSGQHTILFRLVDNDGLIRDSEYKITLLSGAPQVKTLSPLTVWMKDDTTFTLTGTDSNGTVRNYLFDWDNNGSWDDSSNIGTIKHSFASFGSKLIALAVRDEDGVLGRGTATVKVLQGIPTVNLPLESALDSQGKKTTGVVGDTVFYKASGSNETINVSPVFFDTNGTTTRFYFNRGAGSDTNTAGTQKGSSPIYNFSLSASDTNKLIQVNAFGLDEDGNLGQRSFWVYPDGPPPVPTGPSAAVDYGANEVELSWNKNFDTHDGVNTEFQILLKYVTSGEPDSILMNWRKASEIATKTNVLAKFSFKFPLTKRGTDVVWRIKVRDGRGSIASGSIQSFSIDP